jgi:hypothetical protein
MNKLRNSGIAGIAVGSGWAYSGITFGAVSLTTGLSTKGDQFIQ